MKSIHEVTHAVSAHADATTTATHHAGIHVALSAEKLGTFLGLPITNTLLMSWVVVALLAAIAFFVGRKVSLVPSKLQLVFEEMVHFVLGYMQETLGSKKLAQKYFPIVITIFLFVFTANLIEFTPGIGSIRYFIGEESMPLLRSMNTDLNVTLALAIIAFVVIEVAGVTTIGIFKYAGKFLNFK